MGIKFKTLEGKCFQADFCDRNLNLLAHAQSIELDIGSRCGGHGVCGGDRILMRGVDPSELSPITDDERKHLSAGELQQGWRLACQCFPENSDVELSVELR